MAKVDLSSFAMALAVMRRMAVGIPSGRSLVVHGKCMGFQREYVYRTLKIGNLELLLCYPTIIPF